MAPVIITEFGSDGRRGALAAGLPGFARGWWLVGSFFLLLVTSELLAAPRSHPSRVAPAPGTMRIEGVEYLDVADFARRFGLKATWLKKGEHLVLKNETARFELRAESRESEVNGLRVMLGEPAKFYKQAMRISKIDADRFVGPMLRPGVGQSRIPDTKVIALDPGHGGKDSGKTNERLKVFEKTVALDLAIRLKKLLEAQGHRVVMTRSDDRFIEIADRPEIARKEGADLFLSLHFNAAPPAVTGVEVFSLTPQFQFSTDDPGRKDEEGSRLSNPGNAADHWNSLLGYYVQREMLKDLQALDRGHKRQRWGVLRLATCPAILIESGYLSNDGETRKIATPAYRQQIAEAIAAGVKAYVTTLAALRAKQ